MADKRGRSRPVMRAAVRRTERLTPHLIRVVCGGDGLAAFAPNTCTDSYVKVLFAPDGVTYPDPLDLADLPAEQRPRMRTYTVRGFDPDARELVLDFVHHGDRGLAGPWAAQLEAGDEVQLVGPGGSYAPSGDADWHLLVGDESALPAIANALEAMPDGADVRVFVLVEDEREHLPLVTKADAQVQWLHRSRADDLVAAVRALEFPAGEVQAFVHGEAGFVRELRRYLLRERGVERDRVSISGYWRRGADDETWREEKAAERAAEETVNS
ncbi:siderophore-interacting protein [Prauserella halophila]|uniref:Siderophore-interacting protein n=1 Tax=Prauserella halophila TaxID=185641 RepID=A0ABN1VWM9_9PSEU|nr:siderophore-interacting protein [Prauserella halophila]MCP2234523.1 NADPH-dependent ferric siderophore reductase, contains FAD-binding and SIP domains [Prauserella halophila]